MENYVVPNFPQDLSLEIDRLGREIGIFWHKEQYAEAEALFKQQYTLIRKTEEKKLHEGQRFHKGSYLHSWGLSILWQKKLDRVEEGSRKIFLAYVEDLLDFKTIDEVRGAAAYNALIGNPFINHECLEIVLSRVSERKRTGQIPKDPEDVLSAHYKIAEEISLAFNERMPEKKKEKPAFSKNIFIVHGWDDRSKLELARMLQKLGFNPIILSEQPSKGKTIIEQLEDVAVDIGYAFILLTPDDLTVLSAKMSPEPATPEKLNNSYLHRARQNVILELGYFIGKLGRDRVCCLYKGSVELPSDIHGIIYKKFDNSIADCFEGIVEELKAADYKIKL
jgi:predicted nucleotide-binding protein